MVHCFHGGNSLQVKTIQYRRLEVFILEATAPSTADLPGVQPNSTALFYRKIRRGEVGIDESYFSGVRKDERGIGAAGKVAVFGMLKCHSKVFAIAVEKY